MGFPHGALQADVERFDLCLMCCQGVLNPLALGDVARCARNTDNVPCRVTQGSKERVIIGGFLSLIGGAGDMALLDPGLKNTLLDCGESCSILRFEEVLVGLAIETG